MSTASLPVLLAGRYRVMSSVGRGAIAEVVRARDEQTGVELALKILYPHLRESAAVVERFRREVEIVRRLAHPNVLAIHDVIESAEQLFLVMDYHPGGDLADRLARQGRLSVEALRALAAQLCGALAAAHRAGVVHRDVKPSNVLCGPGAGLDVRLCDFGLARATELSGLTTANAVLGTPEYMAPEVVTDGHADPRSDIYSLGVMLFEAATGKLPFYGDSPYQLMRQHVDVEAPRARELVPELPPAIDGAIARALAKDPLDRFATAEDLGRALAADAPATAALIPIAAVGRARRACPHCGGWIVDAAAVCADCGVALLSVDHEKGGVSVLVIGPGQPGDKLDAVKHVALYQLLDELPSGSVALERGRRRAPRVPFYVARELSDASAVGLRDRLQAAGFDAALRRGGVFSTSTMRKKLWAMTRRQSAGLGLLTYIVPRLDYLFERGTWGMGFVWATLSAIGLTWAGTFAWAVSKCRRPLVDSGTRNPGDDPARRLSSRLARLGTRQDRRLVAHILERKDRIAALGRGDVGGALVERAGLAAEGLAALAERRSHHASVSVDSQVALTELRREEMAAVVFRGELLRVASRLDDICLLVARARTPDEIAELDEKIRDLEVRVSAEEEIVALLGAPG